MYLRALSSTLQVDSALKGRLERHSFAYANKRFLKIFPKQEVEKSVVAAPRQARPGGQEGHCPGTVRGGAGLNWWEGWQGREGRVSSL